MSLFSELVALFASVFQPKPVYTTIIYPSQGKPVVVHDGLSIRHERRWQLAESLLEDEVPSFSFSSLHNDPTNQTEPVELFQAESFSSDLLASSFQPMDTMCVNPANGMPMMGIRPAKPSTQPRKTRTWCALKFKWTPVLAF